MSAPTDPQYYRDVAALGQRIGMKPEDFLYVGASETGLDPTLKGAARTTHTLMHNVVDSGLLTQAEWDSLPMLSAAQQLPFIERLYQLLHSKYLSGRNFQDAFEAYLANAAPGLLRYDGRYNAQTVMYGNPNQPGNSTWAANWAMDNYPVGPREAQSRNVSLSIDFAKQLVSEGKLKGWITLGDLKAFGLRPNGIWPDAVARLHSALSTASVDNAVAQVEPALYQPGQSSVAGGYAPDMSKSFSDPSAPVDTRVAPSAAQGAGSSFSQAVRFGLAGAIVWGIWRFVIRS